MMTEFDRKSEASTYTCSAINSNIGKKIIYYTMGYLIISLLLFLIGPVRWRCDNQLELSTYVLICYGALYLGYSTKRNVFFTDLTSKYAALDISERSFRILSIISTIIYVIYSYYIYGGISVNAIQQLGDSYLGKASYESDFNFITQLCTYLWAFTAFYLPIGILMYKKLRFSSKIVFYIALFVNIVYWLAIGTVKGLGDIVIVAFIPLLLTEKRGVKTTTSNKRRRTLIIFIVILFLVTFGYLQEARFIARSKIVYHSYNVQMSYYVEDEYLLPFPFITNELMTYISHGYMGLSLALKLPFEWTYGVGSSRALTSMIETHWESISISAHTYVQRLSDVYGWANGAIWPTCMTWLASDFSFWGVPLVLFCVGRLFAYLICEAIYMRSWVCLVAATQTLVLIAYLPANNQLFQSQRSFWSTVVIILLVMIHRYVRFRFDGKEINL